ncbi:MAG: flippase-like domain-containing protein [Candidatus Cloacimonetes bacterium]|nr:flippase-like domain-containing protein [Candidatus Cloacimonadota bacterium]
MSARKPRRRRRLLDWRALIGIGISVALLWWAFHEEDPAAIWAELKLADPLLFVLAAAAATGVFWIRAWRWKAILAAAAPDTAFRSRFAAVSIGFMGNNLLPLRVGEFARVYALSRMERVSMVASFGSLVIERLFDGIFVVLLLFVAVSLPGFPVVETNTYLAVARGLGVMIALAVIILTLLVWQPVRAVRVFQRIVVVLLPKKLERPLVDALEAFLAGVSSLRNPWLVLRVSAWSLVLWLFNAVGFYVGLFAFGMHLPFEAALFLQSAVALAVSIPSGPGFFGPFEGATRLVLVDIFGADRAQALAYAIGFHLAGFIPITLIGLFYAWRLGLSLREVAETEEVVEERVEMETGIEPVQGEQR